MALTFGQTPEQLLQEADATAQLAGMVCYEKDKRALCDQADRLRERARSLEAGKASVEPPADEKQPPASVVSRLWPGRAPRRT